MMYGPEEEQPKQNLNREEMSEVCAQKWHNVYGWVKSCKPNVLRCFSFPYSGSKSSLTILQTQCSLTSSSNFSLLRTGRAKTSLALVGSACSRWDVHGHTFKEEDQNKVNIHRLFTSALPGIVPQFWRCVSSSVAATHGTPGGRITWEQAALCCWDYLWIDQGLQALELLKGKIFSYKVKYSPFIWSVLEAFWFLTVNLTKTLKITSQTMFEWNPVTTHLLHKVRVTCSSSVSLDSVVVCLIFLHFLNTIKCSLTGWEPLGAAVSFAPYSPVKHHNRDVCRLGHLHRNSMCKLIWICHYPGSYSSVLHEWLFVSNFNRRVEIHASFTGYLRC